MKANASAGPQSGPGLDASQLFLSETRQQEEEMKIKLPFVLVCVNNCYPNRLEFDSQQERRKLSITSLEKLRCFGDGDILRMKKFGQIPC
jgi:hypothetical protein